MTATVTAGKCRDGCGWHLVSQRTPDPIPHGHRRHQGRGLCRGCYDAHEWAGTLDVFGRTTLCSDDVLEDWDTLRRSGRTRTEAAKAIGITVDALDKAIERGIHMGDERAVWAPKSRHPGAIDAADRAVAKGRKGWPRVLSV